MSHLAGMRVYVTGATGFVGGYLVKELLERGAQVIILQRDRVRKSYLETSGLYEKCTVIQGDLENLALQLRIVNEYQINGIIHLAAQTQVRIAAEHPLPTLQANIAGTWNILEAIRQCSHHLRFCIIASTDKAYGEAMTPQYDESHPLNAIFPYDVSKACAEMIAKSYAEVYKLPIVITRCGNFFGPGDLNWDRLIPHVIQSFKDKQAPSLRSAGEHVRDYFYVEDGALAYIFLAEKTLEAPEKMRGQAFNFSYQQQFDVKQVVETIAGLMGEDPSRARYHATAHNEIMHQSLSSEKARRLGWKPKYSFAEGLEKTISWYVNEA